MKEILNIGNATRERLEAAGFFSLTPVYWALAKEWHFEDMTDRGRDLRVFDTGVVVLKGPYEGSITPDICMGAIRVEDEQDLLEVCERIGWL